MAKLIGTAGHVDHGKTTLIKALTGIDADRLPEEKRRGMTIDVGFAHVDLPGHGRVSIVDVPGHERFVHNMLVGALGIDVALLCVAADDAVMPQTREHFHIIDLLPVDRLVVALTRSDLAEGEIRELARADIEELIQNSRFAGSPVIETSATTGQGLEALRQALSAALSTSNSAHPATAPWYLPIDRAFTVRGHGVVVTGTLAQGRIRLGETGFLQPGNREVRVRGIQIHGEAASESESGRRTALNLSGAKLEDIRRGMALGAPGALFETTAFDARVRWLGEVKHGMRVRVSIGAEEAMAKVFLNDEEPDLVQIRLEHPVAAAMDQPLIVRRYSPPDLLGGGRVVVPQARKRRKNERAEVVQAKDLEEAILEALSGEPKGLPTDEVCRRLGQTTQTLGSPFERLLASGRVRGFAGLWMSPEAYEEGTKRFLAAVETLHSRQPTVATVPRERAVHLAGLGWAGKALDRIVADLVEQRLIAASGTAIRLRDFRPQLTPRQRQFLDRVKGELETETVNVPGAHEIAKRVGTPPQAVEEILKVGVQAGELVEVGEGVYYTPPQIEALMTQVREMTKGRSFGAGELREELGTSRKYMIPLLEHFDAIRFTIRVGDNRKVRD
ncbi:MAG: selenocysteine-specific translation elongation factor [Fimbriimonas sp.]